MQEKAIIKGEDNRLTEIKMFLDDIIVSSGHYVSIESETGESKYVFLGYSREEREEILLTLTNFRDNMFRFLSKYGKNL